MTDPSLQMILMAKDVSNKAFKSFLGNVNKVRVASTKLTSSISLLSGAAGTYGIVQLVRNFTGAGVEMDRITKSMDGMTGSSEAAAENIAYLTEETDRLGQVFQTQLKGFNLITAATKGTELAGQGAKDMYTDLMESVTAFQLSEEDAYLSTRAIQQMLAKTTIQAEEMRGQFGERIPIAFKALEIATGSSTKELNDFMKAGQLISKDVVPAMLRVMSLMSQRGVETSSKSAAAEINRLKNTWFRFRSDVMGSGFTAEIASNLSSMTSEVDAWLRDNTENIKGYSTRIITEAKALFGKIEAEVSSFTDNVKGLYSVVTGMTGGVGGLSEYGLLGVFLLGKTGRLIGAIGAVNHLVTSLRNSIRGADLADKGLISGEDYLYSNAKELKKILDTYDKQKDDPFYKMGLELDKVHEKLSAVQEKIEDINEVTRFEKVARIAGVGSSAAEEAIELKKLLVERTKLQDKVVGMQSKIEANAQRMLFLEEERNKVFDAHVKAYEAYLAGPKAEADMAAEVEKGKEFKETIGEGETPAEKASRLKWAKEEERMIRRIAKQSEQAGLEFGNNFVEGFKTGVEGIQDYLTTMFEDVVAISIGTVVGDAVQTTVSDALYKAFDSMDHGLSDKLGAVVGTAAGGVVGAVAGAVFQSVLSGMGGKGEQERANRELLQAILQNTNALKRRTENLTQISSVSRDLESIRSDVIENLKANLVWEKLADDMTFEFTSKYFEKFLAVMPGYEERVAGGSGDPYRDNLLELIDLFNSQLAEVKNVLRAGLQETLLSSEEPFMKTAEIQKRGFDNLVTESLMVLADVYGREGVISKDVLGMLSETEGAYALAISLMGSLTKGTEEWAEAAGVVNDLNAIRINQEKAMRQDLASGLTSSIEQWGESRRTKDFGVVDWEREFSALGESITGLDMNSINYFEDAIDLATSQFDALKTIVAISELQLDAIKDSSESVADQIWDITKGESADTASMRDWQDKFNELYGAATKQDVSGQYDLEAISKFQDFIPDITEIAKAAGYSMTTIEQGLAGPLQTILSNLDLSAQALSKSLLDAEKRAPSAADGIIMPGVDFTIRIPVVIDGTQISEVIVDQLQTNENLIDAVRNA